MERHRLLVVDDEPASLRALRRALAADYAVDCAASAEEALGLLSAGSLSAIITDQRMPGMTGVDLLRRSLATQPDAVRIVLTGYADMQALIDAVNAGAIYHYVTKPWEPQHLLLVVRRGIERLEAERERLRLLHELEVACALARNEANRSRRLVTVAAHELGTPIHLLSNSLELLGGGAAVRQCEWFAVAERALAWLRRCLARIRDVSRLNAGEVTLRQRRLDLASHLRKTVEAVRIAADRNVELRLDVEKEIWIVGDTDWLRQVWVDLLSNGIRFTPDGGFVAVSAARSSALAVIEIVDSGIGMAAEQLADLFDSSSPSSGELLLHSSGRFDFGCRGLGFGLWMARRVIQMHGGTIEAQSEPEKGSRFVVTLPAERES